MTTFIRLTIIILVLTSSINEGFTQDLITKKDGTDIQAKVLEVTTTEVKYKKFDNQTGPTFSLLKTEILMIRYENGTKDVFDESTSSVSQSNGNELCIKGEQDANMYYAGKNSGAGWTTAATILFSPLIGVIPAAACGASEPSNNNLNYPNPDLMKDYNYNRCYKEEAHKKKKKKIWKNFGIGSGVWLLIIILAGA